MDYFALGVIAYEFMMGRVLIYIFYFKYFFFFINIDIRDRIWEEIEKKLEIKFFRNRFKLKKMKYLMGIRLRQLISLIEYFKIFYLSCLKNKYRQYKGNLRID